MSLLNVYIDYKKYWNIILRNLDPLDQNMYIFWK